MNGWARKILEINLSRKSSDVKDISVDICRKYTGGRGLAGYFIAKEIVEGSDAGDMICLFRGPLAGTGLPGAGFCSLSFKSVSGGIGDVAFGGSMGTGIKSAGFDGIIIRGRAKQWTGIKIKDSRVEFVNAEERLGESTSELSNRITGDGAQLLTGRAGTAGVAFANIVSDGLYHEGRGGPGFALGLKKIRYITVDGTQHSDGRQNSAVKTAVKNIARLTAASSVLEGEAGFSSLGTPALYDLLHSRKMMPTANFKKRVFKDAPQLNAHMLQKRYNPVHYGCGSCEIKCRQKTADGRALPGFEALAHFSALLENSDLQAVVDAVNYCKESGMDSLSAAAAIACYAEIKDLKITGSILLKLLDDIVNNAGDGRILRSGAAAAALKMGRHEAAMAVKNVEISAYDPRGAWGMALSYAVSTAGGVHTRAYPVSHEVLKKPVATDRFSFAGKARIIKIQEDQNAAMDSLVVCRHYLLAGTFGEYAAALSGVTGFDITADELAQCGERICYNERIINYHMGIDAKDDTLPERFFLESGSDENDFMLRKIDKKQFLRAKAGYCRVRGLDENGVPVKQSAVKLGLQWIN
jgi:aldehyde:ferredoxin oxidoreductase